MKKLVTIRLEDKQIEWIKTQGSPTKVIRTLINKAMNQTEIDTEKSLFPKCSKLSYHKILRIHYCIDRVKAKSILPKYIKKAKVIPYDCKVCLDIHKKRIMSKGIIEEPKEKFKPIPKIKEIPKPDWLKCEYAKEYKGKRVLCSKDRNYYLIATCISCPYNK